MAKSAKNPVEEPDLDTELEKSRSSKADTAKTHGEILRQQIIEGQETYDKASTSIWLSSFTAGLEIGFSYLLMCSVYSFFSGKMQPETLLRLVSFAYPVGFILVILGQSILFTEQTSLLTLPVLHRKRSLVSLLKLWGVVITGNLLGGGLMAVVLTWIGPRLGIFDLNSVREVARHATDYSGWVLLVSSILAGWLMGLLSWLVAASKDTLSRIVIIYMITFSLSFAGLHHSIVGNVEVLGAMIGSGTADIMDYVSFESTSLLGNAVGGAVFVALLKYRAFVYAARGD